MIAYLKGTIEAAYENYIVLEVNQVGYQIYISQREAQSLSFVKGDICLHTYQHVKEDALQLYGFLNRDDLEIFKLLLGVNGIGPKAALGILSALSADELRFAILSDDAKAISRAPGIGNKTAQKMILELKDKITLEEAFEKSYGNQTFADSKDGGAAADNKAEAIQALTALGYSNSDALKAVSKADVTEDMDTETILKAALKQLAFL